MVPKHHHVDPSAIVERVMAGDGREIEKIKKVEKFLKARLEGFPAGEAKSIAGISQSKTVKAIVSSPVGTVVMETLLADHFDNSKIVNKLQDLWTAQDTKFSKETGFYKSPNWEAQKNGLDRVLELRGYKRKDSNEGLIIPTQIVFNVQSIPNGLNKENAIETKEIPQPSI